MLMFLHFLSGGLASIYIHLKSLSDGLFDKGMTSQSELYFIMVVCDVSFKEKGIKILL